MKKHLVRIAIGLGITSLLTGITLLCMYIPNFEAYLLLCIFIYFVGYGIEYVYLYYIKK